MATLAEAVGVNDTTITVTEGDTPPGRGGALRIDDELLEYVGPARVNLGVGNDHLNRNVWRVRRGKGTTAAAAHDEGATILAATTPAATSGASNPSPFTPGGASDAASVSFDNTTAQLAGDPDNLQAAVEAVAAAPGGGLSNGWTIDTEDSGYLYNEDGPGIVVGDLQETTDYTKIDAGRVSISNDAGTALSVELADVTMLDVNAATGVRLMGGEFGDIVVQVNGNALGLFGHAVAAQPAAVADATDNPTAITQLNDLLAKLRTLGVIAT